MHDSAASNADRQRVCVVEGLRVTRATSTGGSPFGVGLPELVLTAGDAVALCGPSGCGKSTLLWGWLGLAPGVTVQGRIAIGSDWYPAGSTTVFGRLLRHEILMLPQDAKACLDPLERVLPWLQRVSGAKADPVQQALASLFVDPLPISGRFPHQLSGGEAQRVLLALAWLRRPAILIADEPTDGLDPASIDILRRHLRDLRTQGTALLVASHDEVFIESLAARTLYLVDREFRAAPRQRPAWPSPPPPPGGKAPIVLTAHNVCKAFAGRTVLAGVDLAVRAGEVVGILGRSGAGKSTLARILTGQIEADAGSVRVARPLDVQTLFQDARASLTPGRRAGSLLRETAGPGFRIEEQARAVGLDPLRLRGLVDELSGGERRRVALLRATSVEPRVLVLDEPSASLQAEQTCQVFEMLLLQCARRQLAVIVITHDRALADAVCHRRLQLQGGVLCAVE